MPAHFGAQRPAGLGYWPLPEDHPNVAVQREDIRIVTHDRALVRGVLWTPPTGTRVKRTAVVLSHPRGDFSVHYACPLLAAQGYATLGFGTRYMNNDIDCLHDACTVDVEAVVNYLKDERGFDAVVLLGNSGGGSLMALTHVLKRVGDGWVGVAAHPGEGVFMGKVIDPSVADENDPAATIPQLDMYNPDNGWRPWPHPCTYDRAWLADYRAAQLARIQRIDAIAKHGLDQSVAAGNLLQDRNLGSAKYVDPTNQGDMHAYRRLRSESVAMRYLTIYRTLADPAYLDLSIDPDDRPMGSLFAFPDPFDANFGRGGLARTMTARGWLSTWSALSSHARLADTMPQVTVPTLIIHPTADTEIRLHEALEIRDASGADDLTYIEMKGALHYLEGDRPEAINHVVAWLDARFP